MDENRAIGALGGIKTEVHDHSKKSVVKCQIGFINYVLKPFMDAFAKTWGAAIDMHIQNELYDNMNRTLSIW